MESERNHLLESETRARAEAEAALERLHAIQTITDAALAYLASTTFCASCSAACARTLQVDLASVRLLDEWAQRPLRARHRRRAASNAWSTSFFPSKPSTSRAPCWRTTSARPVPTARIGT